MIYSYSQRRMVATSDCVCVWYDYDHLKKVSAPHEIAEAVKKRLRGGES